MAETVNIADLVETAGDAVVVSNASGEIVIWNPAAERIFGFTADEAVGASLDLITPDRHRKRHWDGYETSMRTGETRYGGGELLRVPALHKDGRPLSIAFTVGMLFGPDGRATGVSAIIRDETSRWNDERETRRRLADLERRLGQSPETAPANQAAAERPD